MVQQRLNGKERDEKILKLLRQGLGSNSIAERLGCSKGAVNARILALRSVHPDLPPVQEVKLRGNFR